MTKKKQKLTKEEKEFLKNFKKHTEKMEMLQANDLIVNCDNPYQFAKTHSVYLKDWEKTKKQMIDNIEKQNLPAHLSSAVVEEMSEIGEVIIQKKLEKVRDAFMSKFGESIYNYIDHDGKSRCCLGGAIFFVAIVTTIFLSNKL